MSVRKLFKAFCFLCVTMILCTTVGTSAWYFFAGVKDEQAANDVADYLRPNQVFGDGEDSAIVETEFYDVYFLAQNLKSVLPDPNPDPDPNASYKAFLEETTEVMETDENGNVKYNYHIVNKDSNGDYFYYTNNSKGSKDPRFGKWENAAATSPYFWKYESINMVTASMLLKMGNPSCQLADIHKYPLEFNSWICDPYEHLYAKKDGMTTVTDTNGRPDCLQVYGSYPFRNFEPAYFNMLLENYDARSIYIEGRKTLFFYPIYSTGKGYYALNYYGTGSENIRDSITIENETGNGGEPISHQFVFDPTNTEAMHNIPNNAFANSDPNEKEDTTHYYAYRYTEYIVENENVGNNGFIDNDMDTTNSSWIGKRERLTYNNGTQLTLNERVGRYNIYLFVKERYYTKTGGLSFRPDKDSASFTSEQEDLLLNLCSNTHNIHIYKKFSCDYQEVQQEVDNGTFKPKTRHWNARDYYVLVEKKYEPRIIGGSTGAFDFKNDISRKLAFIRRRGGSDSYSLHNVPINVEEGKFGYNEYTVSTSLRKLKIPDYYFGIQISRDTNLVSNQNIGYDLDLPESEKYPIPMYRYYDVEGIERVEPYESNEVLVSIQDALKNDDKYHDLDNIYITQDHATETSEFYSLSEYIRRGAAGEEGFADDYQSVIDNLVLIRPIQSGNYSFYVHINYKVDPDKNTQDVPVSVDIWAFRKHILFVNIYDPADFGGKTLSFNGEYITGNQINNYSFQCEKYYHLESDLMYDNDNNYKQYKRKEGLAPISELTPNASGNYDLLSILRYYDSKGKCLQDIVSGRYITLDNCLINPFYIEKNYILQVVDKI